MKAAIYTRVSSIAQVDGFSLEAQHDMLVQEVHKRGWELFDVYSDPGESGGNINRPGIQRLLTDMRSKKFGALVIHKLDRLTRNIGDLSYLISEINRLDIHLIIIGYSEPIDTKSAMGKMFLYMNGIFAEIYLVNLREEIYKGQMKRAQNGLRNNPIAPYGYTIGEDLKLLVNDDEAEIVRMLYAWRLEGWGRNKIARELNKKEIPSRSGAKWSEKVVGDILSNLTYTGAITYKRADDPEASRIIVHGVHEALVTQEDYDAAQELQQRAKEGTVNLSPYDYPFSTILKCAVCGRSFNGKISAKYKGAIYRGYRCNGTGRANSSCSASEIAETKITDMFLSRIQSLVDRGIGDEEIHLSAAVNVVKERKRLEKQIADSKERRKKWAKAMGDGKMSYEDYSELVDEEQRRTAELVNQLQALPEPDFKKKAATQRELADKLRDLERHWPVLSNHQRKEIVQKLFKRIVIGKVHGEWAILGHEFS